MSKERELLKRHCNWKLSVEEHLKLLRETEALLAQPEHILDISNMVKQKQFKPERMTDEEISVVIADYDPTPKGARMFKLGIRWYEKYKARIGVYDDIDYT